MIEYSDQLTERERALLQSKSEGVVAATNCTSLIWTVDEPELGRRWFRLRHYTNRNRVFVAIAEPDLERLSAETLNAKIIQGEVFDA